MLKYVCGFFDPQTVIDNKTIEKAKKRRKTLSLITTSFFAFKALQQKGFVLLLSKVNAIGLLTHSYQKSCALRGSAVHETRIRTRVQKFGVWALPNKKRCPDRHHACKISNH
jgi:hypothetical protein